MRAAAASRAMTSHKDSDELRADLEEKSLALLSVQRNYESMSRLMQLRQQEIEKLKLQYEGEQAQCVSLGVRLQEAEARAESFEAQYTKLKPLPDQLAALQVELQKLRYDASVASGKVNSNSERVSSLQRQIEEGQFESNKLQRALESARSAEAKAKADAEKMRKEVEELRVDGRARDSELRAMRDQVASAMSQVQAADQRTSDKAQRLSSIEYRVEELQEQIRVLKEQAQEEDASHRATRVSLSTMKSQYAVLEGQMRSMQRTIEISEHCNTGLRNQLGDMSQELEKVEDKCKEQESKIKQLTHLLSDSEERYQVSLTQRVESDEVQMALQVQLVQSKSMLTDCRRQFQENEAQYDEALRHLRAQERAALSLAQDTQLQLDQERSNFARVFEAVLAQVEAMDDRLVQIQSSMNTAVLQAHDKQEKGMSHIAYKIQVWEQKCMEMEELVESRGMKLSALKSIAERRYQSTVAGHFAAASETAAVTRLKNEVERLNGMLMQEAYARQAAAQTQQQQELEHQDAMSALRASLNERVELERQRLAARLSTLEAEAARLEAASKEAHQAAEQTINLERAQFERALSAARAEVVEWQQKLEDYRLSMSNTNRYEMAALSRLHNDELEKIKKLMSAKESDLKVVQSNVMSAWEAEQKLLSDMRVVTSHMIQMGWDVKVPDAVVMDKEDGSGCALAKASLLLRLNFSYITEAVQHVARAPPKLTPPPAPQIPGVDWKELSKELRHTVNKIIHVEESLASNCTCMLCMEVFAQPVTCNPCGHTYCKACFSRNGGKCKECGDLAPVGGAQLNPPLDAICSKYEYKLSALKSIQKAVQQANATLK